MSSRRKRTKKQPDIPTELKVSLTPAMRANMATEEFEPTAPPSVESKQPSEQQPIAESGTEKSEKPHTKLRKEKNRLVLYENEPQSVYDQSAGTNSFESILPGSISDAVLVDQKPKEKMHKLRKMKLPPIKLLRNEILTEEKFLEGMLKNKDGKYMTGIKEEIIYTRRGEAEMVFIQTLIDDVNGLVALSGRTDISLQYAIEFEENGLPRLKMRLGPKRRASDSREDEEKWRQAELEKEEAALLRKFDKPPQNEHNSLLKVVGLVNAGLQMASYLP